jgi:hypothetical protein
MAFSWSTAVPTPARAVHRSASVSCELGCEQATPKTAIRQTALRVMNLTVLLL